jgi:hypothetical protein
MLALSQNIINAYNGMGNGNIGNVNQSTGTAQNADAHGRSNSSFAN